MNTYWPTPKECEETIARHRREIASHRKQIEEHQDIILQYTQALEDALIREAKGLKNGIYEDSK